MGKESNIDPAIKMNELTEKRQKLEDAQNLNRKKYFMIQEIYNMKKNLDTYEGYHVENMTILNMAIYINDCNHLQACLRWIYNEDYFLLSKFVRYSGKTDERKQWKPSEKHPYHCAHFSIIKEPFEQILADFNLKTEDNERSMTVLEGEIQDCKKECQRELDKLRKLEKCRDELKHIQGTRTNSDKPLFVRSPTIIFTQNRNDSLAQVRGNLKRSANVFLSRAAHKGSIG